MQLVRSGEAPNLVWELCRGEDAVAHATSGVGSEPSSCYLRLSVDPDYRHRGLGRRLLERVSADVRAVGYQTLETVVLRESAGESFAIKAGAVVGDELIEDVLPMAHLDEATLARMAADVPSSYELVHWRDPAPDPIVTSYATAKRSITDAPNRYAPAVPHWTAALVRQAERDRASNGVTNWVSAAMHEGQVVAFSEISTSGMDDADQQATVVLAEHRRRGLASGVKADLILRLRAARPDIRTVGVTCALANAGMRTVNRRLGFLERRRRRLMRLALG